MVKKQPATAKFSGELAEPIVLKMSPLPPEVTNAEGKKVRYLQFHGLLAKMEKLAPLAKHYDAMDGDRIDFQFLALRMAFDLVPGFKVLYDHPVARALNLPDAYRGKTKPKGKSDLPEEVSGEFLILLFKGLAGHFKNEVEGSKFLVVCCLPGLAGRAHKKERESKAKTLRNRLAAARNARKEAAQSR